jgi:hypothetical protein
MPQWTKSREVNWAGAAGACGDLTVREVIGVMEQPAWTQTGCIQDSGKSNMECPSTASTGLTPRRRLGNVIDPCSIDDDNVGREPVVVVGDGVVNPVAVVVHVGLGDLHAGQD